MPHPRFGSLSNAVFLMVKKSITQKVESMSPTRTPRLSSLILLALHAPIVTGFLPRLCGGVRAAAMQTGIVYSHGSPEGLALHRQPITVTQRVGRVAPTALPLPLPPHGRPARNRRLNLCQPPRNCRSRSTATTAGHLNRSYHLQGRLPKRCVDLRCSYPDIGPPLVVAGAGSDHACLRM